MALEVVNFLMRKAGFSTALETLHLFRVHERIRIINVNSEMFDALCKVFEEYPGLSITDASIVTAMQSLGVQNLYSFDRVPWIERLEG